MYYQVKVAYRVDGTRENNLFLVQSNSIGEANEKCIGYLAQSNAEDIETFAVSLTPIMEYIAFAQDNEKAIFKISVSLSKEEKKTRKYQFVTQAENHEQATSNIEAYLSQGYGEYRILKIEETNINAIIGYV